MMNLRLLLITALLFALPVTAAYKWTKPDGTVVFSDEPPHPDAEEIKLPLTPSFTPLPLKKVAPVKNAKEGVESAAYSSLLFSQPENEQTIRDNTGSITISLIIEPALNTQLGHKILIKLDGETSVTTTSLQAVVPGIDRGSHTLQALIVDTSNTTLFSSPTIQVYLRRFSTRH